MALALALAASTAYQAPLLSAPRPAALSSRTSAVTASVFDGGMSQFKADYPWLAKYGFGPSGGTAATPCSAGW